MPHFPGDAQRGTSMDGKRPGGTRRTTPRVLVAPAALAALAALAAGAAAQVPTASAVTTGSAISSVAGPSAQTPVADAIATYLRGRSGGTTVAVRDDVSRTSFTVNGSQRHYCASIVKVDILQTLLHQRHGSLTSSQRALAARMIQESDN